MSVRGMGLDIIGKLPRAVGGYLYLLVAINKFTITTQAAVKFIMGIFGRFGVPNSIIIDMGSQFTSGVF
jgi:hypothetical protein